MDNSSKQRVQNLACQIRMGVVEETFHAKSGHPGGSLSIADLLAYLYEIEMRYDVANPQWEDRDRLVLSKGHAAPALYAVLAHKGFFPVSTLKTLRHIGSILQGHPDMRGTPGVDMSTGSLGQGISAACGIALGGKLSQKDFRVFAILGDGELEEGQVWEAMMFASHKKLDNLMAFVDNNDLQIDGTLDEVNSPYPIREKLEAFGWEVLEICAHELEQIEKSVEYFNARPKQGVPLAVVMKSVKGKGVSFMENQVCWHGMGPNQEQCSLALGELNRKLASLEVE